MITILARQPKPSSELATVANHSTGKVSNVKSTRDLNVKHECSNDVFIDAPSKQSMTSYFSRNSELGKEANDYADYFDYDKSSDDLHDRESDDIYI